MILAASTSVPVTVLIVVAITGGLANIAAAVAGIVNTWVNEHRYEDQRRQDHEQAQQDHVLTQKIAVHLGLSEEEVVPRSPSSSPTGSTTSTSRPGAPGTPGTSGATSSSSP